MNVFVKIKAKFIITFFILLLFPLNLKCQDTTEATTEKEEDTSKDNSTSDISCHFVDNQNNTLICQSLLVTELDLKFIPEKLKTLILNETGIKTLEGSAFENHSIHELVIENNILLENFYPESLDGVQDLYNLTIRNGDVHFVQICVFKASRYK